MAHSVNDESLIVQEAMATPPPSRPFGTLWDDEPCLERCRSKQHGKQIWEIAQGGELEDGPQVVCLWEKTCCNYSQVKDEFGRTALHAAVTMGKLKAVEWLLKTQQCNINAKDLVSGYTPLHRSIYFGYLQITRSLIKHGADIHLRDHEGLTPFELCQMDRPIPFKQNAGDMTELTVWGSNANYNLGIGHQQPRLHPDVAPEFRRTELSLAKVEMNTYHTLFLTQQGKVYACGYGMGGRLGTGDEVTVLSPAIVNLRNNGPCRDIAVGQDHSIFLTDSKVWTVGSNEFGQLGHTNILKLCNPRTIDSLQKFGISGILAGPFHSVFYNSQTVLVCGQNQGQFGRGFDEVTKVSVPSKLKISLDNVGNGLITTVGGNEFCTAVCVEKRYIFLLRRHQYIRIDSRNTTTQEILKIQASGEKNSITLFLLTGSGRVLVWRENFSRATSEPKGGSLGQFTRLVYSNSRLLDVKDFSVSLSSLVVINSTGEAYKAGWNCNNPPSIIGRMEERYGQVAAADFQVAVRQRRAKKEDEAPPMELELMKIKRVPNVHTGLFVSSDPKGMNFAILQRHQMMDVTCIPEAHGFHNRFHSEVRDLYQEMTEDDSIHDVIFTVGSFDRYPAHRFILASASTVFEIVLQNNLSCSTIEVSDKLFGVDPAKCTSLENSTTFRAVLELIYLRRCSFTSQEYMKEILQSCKQDGKRTSAQYAEKTKEVGRFKNLCRYLGLEEAESLIQRFMGELQYNWGIPLNKNSEAVIWPTAKSDLPDMGFFRVDNDAFLDVVLESTDKVTFPAHKCILVARLKYFKSLFSANWSYESSKTNTAELPKMLLPFSSKTIEILLECVYSSTADALNEADCELLCETLACSDYMMNDRLMQLAEVEMVRHITLKNVADVLGFAWKHNSMQLRNTCFDFIALNLTAMLENRLLDNMPLRLLEDFSSYYRNVQMDTLERENYKYPGRDVPELEDYQEAVKCTSKEVLEQLESIVESDEAMVLKKAQVKAPRSRVRLRSRTFSESEDPAGATGKVDTRNDKLRLSCSGNFETSTPPISPSCVSDVTPPVTPATPAAPEKTRKLIVPLPKNFVGFCTPPQAIQSSRIKFDEFPTLGASAIAKSPPSQSLVMKSVAPAVSSPTAKAGTSKGQMTTVLTPEQPIIQTTPPPQSQGKKKTKWRVLNSPADVVTKAAQLPTSTAMASTSASALTVDGRDRNNPWKVKSQSSPANQVVFQAIVEDEVERRVNFQEATSKPLPMMQIEDAVINTLTHHYTSVDTEDFIELLTVERVVKSNLATPMWVQHPGAVTSSSYPPTQP